MAAIVLDSHPELSGPGDVEALWSSGEFERARIESYLASRYERFDLLGGPHPFYQVANLEPVSGKAKPASALLLEVASGNNIPLFSALTEAAFVKLPPVDAFLALLSVHGYDTAGIKTGAVGDPAVRSGKTTGNPTGNLGQLGAVIPLGSSLFHTILLNIPLVPRSPDDRPAWDRDTSAAWERRYPTGVLDLLTWQSRRVRLVPADDGDGVVGAIISGGDRLPFVPPSLEPHTRWRDTKNSDVALRPIRWKAGSPAWQGLDSMLALAEVGDSRTSMLLRQMEDMTDWLDDEYPLSVLCIGAEYGNQSAVIEDVFVDSVPMPIAALRGRDPSVRQGLTEVVLAAEKVRKVLNDLADNIRIAEGGERIPWDQGTHPGNDAMMLLTGPTTRLLLELQREPARLEMVLLEWERTISSIVHPIADRLLDAASPSAFRGREITSGSKKRTVRLADAEAWFRAGLREALPRQAAASRSERSSK